MHVVPPTSPRRLGGVLARYFTVIRLIFCPGAHRKKIMDQHTVFFFFGCSEGEVVLDNPPPPPTIILTALYIFSALSPSKQGMAASPPRKWPTTPVKNSSTLTPVQSKTETGGGEGAIPSLKPSKCGETLPPHPRPGEQRGARLASAHSRPMSATAAAAGV